MSASKRLASDSFGSSQLVVKRQKSNVDLGNGSTATISNNKAGNAALIQAVGLSFKHMRTCRPSAERITRRRSTDGG